MIPRPGLLLDRDGVINVEIHRLHRPEDVILVPGTAHVIATVNGWGVPVAVITNQAGIGHGLYDEAALASVNQRITALIARDGAHLDGWFHCPHTPEDACDCRKPEPGLLHQAARALDLDLTQSIVVGDKRSDLKAAHAVGSKAFLVRTGYGAEVDRVGGHEADLVRDSLLDFLPDLERLLRPLA